MNIQFNIPIIVGLSIIAVFFFIIFICVYRDRKQQKSLGREISENEWLFSNWEEKLYDSFFHDEPKTVAKRLGFKFEEYSTSCKILNIPMNMKSFLIKKILGIVIAIIFLLVMFILKNIICVAGVLIGLLLFMTPGSKEKKQAAELKKSIIVDLPRFLSLLQTALYISLPIEEAIKTTAEHMKDSNIAIEFINTMSDVKLGAHSWNESLRKMAERFQIDEFSDFVLDLTISYEKGLNIYQLVVDRSEMVKNSNLLNAKESSAKLHSKIIMPIVIFKLVPMIAMLMIPIMKQAMEGLV